MSSIHTTPIFQHICHSRSEATMKAVVLTAPFKVELRDKPKPEIQEPTDVIIRTSVAALCGLTGSVLILIDGGVLGGLVGLACTALTVFVGVRASLQHRRAVEDVVRRESLS